MPQMAPISWFILFIMFSMVFIMLNILNYYCSLPQLKNKTNLLTVSQTSLNWKW